MMRELTPEEIVRFTPTDFVERIRELEEENNRLEKQVAETKREARNVLTNAAISLEGKADDFK